MNMLKKFDETVIDRMQDDREFCKNIYHKYKELTEQTYQRSDIADSTAYVMLGAMKDKNNDLIHLLNDIYHDGDSLIVKQMIEETQYCNEIIEAKEAP